MIKLREMIKRIWHSPTTWFVVVVLLIGGRTYAAWRHELSLTIFDAVVIIGLIFSYWDFKTKDETNKERKEKE